MQLRPKTAPKMRKWFTAPHLLCTLGLLAGGAVGQAANAAEVELLGTGTFMPFSAERLARVPATLPFSAGDLASGNLSFAIRYDDRSADSDPDPYVGRHIGAIRAVRLTVGSKTLELPVQQTEIVVSDGGLGFPERESIRLQATAKLTHGVMQFSWTQVRQTPTRMDLRGATGAIASDAMPAPALVAHLPTDRPFDRFFLVRVDAPDQARPLLYLSSSTLSVSARPLAAP